MWFPEDYFLVKNNTVLAITTEKNSNVALALEKISKLYTCREFRSNLNDAG